MNSAEKQKLKAQAHALNPVVIIGQAGLTEAVINETDLALTAHELIKVKIRAERDERASIKDRLCTETQAEAIQSIGQIVVLYRKNPDR